ncbi:MAG: TetR/AcrR family transcriptional regulator [Syntrophales bacterium]
MGISERKRREKEGRIRQIQNSAAAVFYSKGYAGATMEEIAEAAELSKATLYLYYKSKVDIFYSIIEPALSKLGKLLIRIANDRDEPADATIKKIIDATYRMYMKDPEAYHMLSRYNAAQYMKILPKDKLEHLKNIMRSNLRQMEEAVRKGIEQGIFKKTDPKLTSIVIWNCYMGVIQYQENRMEPGKSDYRKPTLDAAIGLLLKGLKRK